jgi:hypothetical protein
VQTKNGQARGHRGDQGKRGNRQNGQKHGHDRRPPAPAARLLGLSLHQLRSRLAKLQADVGDGYGAAGSA